MSFRSDLSAAELRNAIEMLRIEAIASHEVKVALWHAERAAIDLDWTKCIFSLEVADEMSEFVMGYMLESARKLKAAAENPK